MQRYTKDEEEWLRKNYHIYGPKGCVDKYFKNRTTRQIIKKASHMGLLYRTTKFTNDEISFLKENYPPMGIDYCCERLTHYTKDQIKSKVETLKLRLDSLSMFTEQDIETLKENYPKIGLIECSKLLPKFTEEQISSKIRKLKLTLHPEVKRELRKSAYTLPEYIEPALNPNICYLLGFIWGDGYIHQPQTTYRCYSKIEICKDDSERLIHLLDTESISYSSYTRQRKNRKEQICITINDYNINNFLLKHDYVNKSHTSCKKIMDKISTNLQSFFLLGLIDADGCFYYNDKNYCRHFTLCASYEYNWEPICELLNNIGVTHTIINSKKGKYKHSVIRICSKEHIRKLAEYIYKPNFIYFFERKYQKCLEMFNVMDL